MMKRNQGSLRLAVVVALLALGAVGAAVGCGGAAPADDGGINIVPPDAGPDDAGVLEDGGTVDDGGALDDSGVPNDGGVVDDGGTDGGTDGGVLDDGGTGDDAGTDAGQTLPDGGPMPIKYIVVIVKENHTFDSYFTGFPGAASSATAKLSDGGTLTRPTAPSGALDRDLCHKHSCATTAYNAGKLNHLDQVPGALRPPDGGTKDNLAFIRYKETQIPNYWQYARNFVLADHFFSTTFANSFPGHFATTSGFNVALGDPTCTCTSGTTCTISQYDPATCQVSTKSACWSYPSVVFNLPEGFTWAEYGTATLEHNTRVLKLTDYASHFKSVSSLKPDLASPSQANLIFAHINGSVSEHPPEAVCPGENNSVDLINTIMNGPHWNETAILLLWDDWGGFYDSVSSQATKCATGDFMRPGFRIPLLVISPYAKKGYVLTTKAEQASVVRLIEDLWGLPRMSGQDSRILDSTAGSLLGAFDFTQAPRAPFILNPRVCP